MAALLINRQGVVPPVLKAWQGVGLNFLLLEPEAVTQFGLSAKPTSVKPELKPAAPTTPPRAARSISGFQTNSAVNEPVTRSVSANVSEVQKPKSAQNLLNPESWPAQWQKLWQQPKAFPRNPAIVWTYPELGQDLLGQAPEEERGVRRQLMVKMIRALNLGAEKNTFLPYKYEQMHESLPHLFLSLLGAYAPRLVVALGVKVTEDLGSLGALPEVPMTLNMVQGHKILLMPKLEQISKLSEPALMGMLDFIRLNLN